MPTDTDRPRKSERQHRQELVAVCRRMYERGYIAGLDGNASVRLGERRILATPAGRPKGELDLDDLVVTDPEGRPLHGSGTPSSELRVHLAAYRLRPEVQAVVHAHPPYALAHSLAGVSLAPHVVPETVATLGRIADTDYGTPGTPELAQRMEDALRCHDAVLMERHGTVTLGVDLSQAYYRLEALEHTARILYLARTLGPVEPLPADEVERLYALAEKAGIRWPFRSEAACRASCASCASARGGAGDDGLVDAVVARVLQSLSSR